MIRNVSLRDNLFSLDTDWSDVAKYLGPEEVCELIPGMTKALLAQLRFQGKGPRYRAPTPRKIVYVESEVIDWIELSARTQTGQAVSA